MPIRKTAVAGVITPLGKGLEDLELAYELRQPSGELPYHVLLTQDGDQILLYGSASIKALIDVLQEAQDAIVAAIHQGD